MSEFLEHLTSVFKSQEIHLSSAIPAKGKERKEGVLYNIICKSNGRHHCGDSGEPGPNKPQKQIASVVFSPVQNRSQRQSRSSTKRLWMAVERSKRLRPFLYQDKGYHHPPVYGHLLSYDHMKG